MVTDTRCTDMKTASYLTSLVLVLLTTAGMAGEDLQRKYVGQSKCMPELQSATVSYGIRLDKSQKAYLAAYRIGRKDILTIVQYKANNDRCGIIRDIVQSRKADSSFVWECKARMTPQDVVVGTWPAKHPEVSGPAVEAWRIDMKQLRFVSVHGRVACTAGDYAGSDEDGDLASWAKKRSAKPAVPRAR
jgi:hypothetical protein